MSDMSLSTAQPTRRMRRGPPPRLYVINRQSPVRWLRIRRLGEADRPVLLAHLRRLLPEDRRLQSRLEAMIAARCLLLDFSQIAVFGAIAGRDIIGAACATTGLVGLEASVTVDSAYRGREVEATLTSQVFDAATRETGTPMELAGASLPRLLRSLGGGVRRPGGATMEAFPQLARGLTSAGA